MTKKTLVLGASLKPQRYAYKAIVALREKAHEVIALGRTEGTVSDVKINSEKYRYKNIDTISVYLSEKNQADYEDYIIELNPERIIFNPGAENPSLFKRARENKIEALNACTLVMLSTGQY